MTCCDICDVCERDTSPEDMTTHSAYPVGHPDNHEGIPACRECHGYPTFDDDEKQAAYERFDAERMDQTRGFGGGR